MLARIVGKRHNGDLMPPRGDSRHGIGSSRNYRRALAVDINGVRNGVIDRSPRHRVAVRRRHGRVERLGGAVQYVYDLRRQVGRGIARVRRNGAHRHDVRAVLRRVEHVLGDGQRRNLVAVYVNLVARRMRHRRPRNRIPAYRQNGRVQLFGRRDGNGVNDRRRRRRAFVPVLRSNRAHGNLVTPRRGYIQFVSRFRNGRRLIAVYVNFVARRVRHRRPRHDAAVEREHGRDERRRRFGLVAARDKRADTQSEYRRKYQRKPFSHHSFLLTATP